MAAAQVIPIRTLYAVESDLAALLECVETVEPAQEQEFLTALGAALESAKDKRDRVAQYMAHCESQVELAKAEMDRLRERRASFETQLEKLKTYVARVMDEAGVRKLEGNSVTFSLRKNPASVEVLDEEAVPASYKTATLTMSGELVDCVLDALDIDAQVKLAWSCDKRAIKSALDGGADVPGAAIAPDKFALVRK